MVFFRFYANILSREIVNVQITVAVLLSLAWLPTNTQNKLVLIQTWAVSRRDFVVPSPLWASCSAVRLRLRSLIFYFHLVLSAILDIKDSFTSKSSFFRSCGRNYSLPRGYLFYSQTAGKPNPAIIIFFSLQKRKRNERSLFRGHWFSSCTNCIDRLTD